MHIQVEAHNWKSIMLYRGCAIGIMSERVESWYGNKSMSGSVLNISNIGQSWVRQICIYGLGSSYHEMLNIVK